MVELPKESHLLFFTGTECAHCHEMDPLVEKLEKKHKVKVLKLEVWHNANNMALLQELDNGQFGGIPFFYNTKTKKSLFGNQKYEKLVAWAKDV